MAIKVTIKEGAPDETHTRVTAVRDGVESSGMVPDCWDSGDEILELKGDPAILLAAAAAWDGLREEFELTDEELEEQGDGHWSAP